MAKPDHTWIGNSCHVHASLWREGARTPSPTAARSSTHFLAGWIACASELAVFLAPNDQLLQALRRRAAGRRRRSPGATTTARAASGSSARARSKRVETRIPGGDVNPYLAFAALIAAGLYGIEHGLELPPPLEGQRLRVRRRALPLDAARGDRGARAGHDGARGPFGDEVVEHYLNYARTEQRLFDQVVTCWERERLFERG
jgi:glutamine synthetase